MHNVLDATISRNICSTLGSKCDKADVRQMTQEVWQKLPTGELKNE